MLKKLCVLLVLALLLCAGAAAWAEDGVDIEVIRVDGESVIVLTPRETVLRAQDLMVMTREADGSQSGFILPQSLTIIGEGAFEGIAAGCVEVSENVVSIEARAFADCKALREIHIPATVLKMSDQALEGCENVTVYGVKGSEAERFAQAAGFTFVEPSEEPSRPCEKPAPPVELPVVVRK